MATPVTIERRKSAERIGRDIETLAGPEYTRSYARSAREQWRRVSDGFRSRFPRLAELMDEAEEDVLACAALPADH